MIVFLAPGLLSFGGVQQAARNTGAVLSAYAARREIPFRCLSLNDPPAVHPVSVGEVRFDVRGFGRAKLRFLSSAVRLALGWPRVVVAAHPNLAPVAWSMQVLGPRLRVLVIAHGVEAWRPLLAFRRWSLRRADLILAPSMETARRLATVQRVPNEKIRRLPWGLDPSFHSDVARASTSELPAGFPRGRAVLTVGRLSRIDQYKGVDRLIEALPRLLPQIPDIHLVVVGEGDDRPRLEDLSKSLGLAERVHFLGELRPEALVACYSRCDVFAMPSHGEGFGIVFLEAMALGKPVVGGANGGTPEVVEDGVSGFLVPNGDSEQLAAALERLLTDVELRRQMGLRGRERVSSLYRFEAFQARLTQILDDTCAF